MAISMLFAGFGGQGVLFAGKVAAYTALLEDKHVTWLPSYGPEMRGGTANCSVCISDEPIGSPIVENMDILVAMNGPSYDKFMGMVKAGGILIADSSLISDAAPRIDIKQYFIPATELAESNGLARLGNIICLGYALRISGFSTEEILIEAISNAVSDSRSELIEKNVRAFKLGIEYKI